MFDVFNTPGELSDGIAVTFIKGAKGKKLSFWAEA